MWWVLGSVADFVFDFGSLCLSSVGGRLIAIPYTLSPC